MNPFTLITEPTAVRRILFSTGLLDVANNIVGDGFCFVPIECDEHWGLVIASKEPDGTVSHRVVTCKKEAGAQRMSAKFAEIMEGMSHRAGLGHNMRVQLESPNRN